jgi:cyclopropane-fatty-acyl-phospholipid synthase
MTESTATNTIYERTPRSRALDRWLRRRLLSRLTGLQGGRLIVEDFLGRELLGRGAAAPTDLDVGIDVLDPAFYRAVAANGSLGAGQAYLDGLWRCHDLVGLIRLLVRNRNHLDGLESGAARAAAWCLRRWHALRRNSRAGAVRNIAAHYDLSPEFFALFLSADLMYSCACWSGEGDTLEAASARKLERICRQLDLQSSDHVCEIGSGWGGFAFHAAENYGCRVTTCTISKQQHAHVIGQIRARGLSDRVQVHLTDYRDLTGQFDKLVSIEMIEAVGAEYLEDYFATVAKLLKGDGRALIQAITIEDHRYAQALASVDYIKRYIFPGSFIPSLQAILTAKMRACDLYLTHAEDFGDSYARTLQAWRTRFLERLSEVRALGFDERFIRRWEYYLAYCEGGFRERSIGVTQLLFIKPRIGAVVSSGPTPG